MRYLGEVVTPGSPFPDATPEQRALLVRTIAPQLNENQSQTMAEIAEATPFGHRRTVLKYALGGAVGLAAGVGIGALVFRRKR
jgi:hypothetical protein